MWAVGLTVRMRRATITPRRRAVCMGTAMAMIRARVTFSASNGSTERSITAGVWPARSRNAAGHATESGW